MLKKAFKIDLDAFVLKKTSHKRVNLTYSFWWFILESSGALSSGSDDPQLSPILDLLDAGLCG